MLRVVDVILRSLPVAPVQYLLTSSNLGRLTFRLHHQDCEPVYGRFTMLACNLFDFRRRFIRRTFCRPPRRSPGADPLGMAFRFPLIVATKEIVAPAD